MATERQKELGLILKPLVDLATEMILAGVLTKNVIKHFTNKGFPFAAAENITEVAIFQAEELMKQKAI